jgi:hypothetical protein
VRRRSGITARDTCAFRSATGSLLAIDYGFHWPRLLEISLTLPAPPHRSTLGTRSSAWQQRGSIFCGSIWKG